MTIKEAAASLEKHLGGRSGWLNSVGPGMDFNAGEVIQVVVANSVPTGTAIPETWEGFLVKVVMKM